MNAASPHPQPLSPEGRGEKELNSAALPLPLAREVEAIYQRFESAWRAGERPQIEDYLSGLPELALQILLPELLELELHCRRGAGEIAHLDEYRQRFPEHSALFESIFREKGVGNQNSQRGSETPAPGPVTADALPACLGRYRVTALLGAGGCGVVYKAHDDDLEREVAIKVPHRHRIATAADIEAYLIEARMLATLDHSGIVPVHDVGRTADGLCFVVSKFIAGQDLRARLQQGRLPCAKAVALVVQVAEALHHAHRRGLVHRDVKPANILLDDQDRPVVADFGLALRDADFGTGPQLAGTPAYMSPEQARGEGHRVDARSDIYSLGVVFYEMLTGQRPYRSERPLDILEEIKSQDPRPPRLLNDAVPAELDRICMRALAKRAADRYSTAQDFAADLRDWQSGRMKDEGGRIKEECSPTAGSSVPPSSLLPHSSRPPNSFFLPALLPARVVPKGLRAYDAADADFFLELLPGPRDRHGLPDSIRFWKQRIEETDAAQTFSVGLLYGPSGCGKSSLTKAGLLPRLAAHVQAIYIEATPDETEVRLLKGVRKRCPELSDKLGLVESIAELRRRGAARSAKLLLVLDQFEQWLHAKRSEQHTELVQALRQCDGEHVQCLVLVRDDFGMAAARFMKELEIRIVEGRNFATVDLFDPSHARNVLAQFGRAFGQLPVAALSLEQERFLEQAVAGLAQDGKVISVRLALFAEMVKGKPWTSATLRQVGGAEGVGVTFLEETFSSSSAPPPHRLHQKAARAVLKALLPEPGADIKGHMRSHQELQDAAAYAERPKEFADLMHILDTELRLVTPTEGGASDEGRETSAAGSSHAPHLSPLAPAYYQLTHDYLVPALRQWLTSKQRETRQGRMELLLAERVSLWAVKQDSRQLPGWWEWLNILLWTRSSSRTEPQRDMLRAATRRRLLQAFMLVLFAALFGWIMVEVYRGPVKADHLVRSLASADIQGVEQIIDDLESCRRWADPKLRALAAPTSSEKERLHASLALLPEPEHVAYLEKQLLEVSRSPDEVLVIARRLRRKDYHLEVAARLQALLNTKPMTPEHRCRAACALAFIQPRGDAFIQPGEEGQGVKKHYWEEWSDEVANVLVKKDLESAKKWCALPIEGVGPILFRSLKNVFLDPKRPESERTNAAALTRNSFLPLDSIASTKDLMEFLLQIDGEPYTILNEWFIASGHDAAKLVKEELNLPSRDDPAAVDALARRQAHAAVLLLQLEDWDKLRGPLDKSEHILADRLWLLLRESKEPRLQSLRSYLTHRFASTGVKAEVLLNRYATEKDVSARRALLLSLGEFKSHQVPASAGESFVRAYRNDPDPGIHSALDWLLRKWKLQPSVNEFDRDLATGKVEGKRQWYVTAKHRHAMAVIVGPKEFTMGSSKDEPDRRPDETPHLRHIPRSFAIATKEVTFRQFREFLNANKHVHHDWAPTDRHGSDVDPDDGPVLGVTWFAATQYCRWLSEQEGIRDDDCCYPPIPDIKDGMRLPTDYLMRTGYRLPTEAEWEYACRADAVTSRPHGIGDALLERYACYERNAFGRASRVGSLKPNDLGLFDMLGNASEWCHDALRPYPPGRFEDREQTGPILGEEPRVLRGGGFFSAARELRAAHRNELQPQKSSSQAGFRVCRTMR